MDSKTARSLIATVRAVGQSSSDPTEPSEWRATRDGFVDALDPSGHHGDVDNELIRSLIEWLGETRPSRESRQTGTEWEKTVDDATTRLLGELR
ncbi:hypothetical protein [Glaciihabitans sp. UYNi722]|uniref:hypothetical protein n=1 Tax=Glaciihabitans sp. UYNi722 TaxID=3156344 RepID=UPI00339A09FE